MYIKTYKKVYRKYIKRHIKVSVQLYKSKELVYLEDTNVEQKFELNNQFLL